MGAHPANVSFDGAPVRLQLDSPSVAFFDPIALGWIAESLSALPEEQRRKAANVLSPVNETFPAVGCYEVQDFKAGTYRLSPADIRAFGDDDCELDWTGDNAQAAPAEQETFPFASVDSGTLILVDFSRLAAFVIRFTPERYELWLRGRFDLDNVVAALGGPYFAVVAAASNAGIEFEGDGVYCLRSGSLQPCAP